MSEPWMIREHSLDVIRGIVDRKIDGLNGPMDIEAAFAAAGKQPAQKASKPYEMSGDTAIIPLMGPLIPKANLFSRISGATSYQEVASALSQALADESVSSIVLSVDSPGGSVQGAFECAQCVRDARGQKPIVTMADGQCCSAAYLIGCQTDQIYCSVGAEVGSIGVIWRGMSQDRALANQGVDQTIIRSSELKAVGAGPMTPNQMQSIQARVNQLFGMFKDQVQAARPICNIDAVATGETWIGKDAVSMGLCDGVTTMDKVLKMLA